MTSSVESPELIAEQPPAAEPRAEEPQFILYLDGAEYHDALNRLNLWVRHLLLPVYGREVTSGAPWCSRWWEHPEAVAQLYGLWMAWQHMTDPSVGLSGPAQWHRDYLTITMNSLRDPSGPFSGCRTGAHRPKQPPTADEFPS